MSTLPLSDAEQQIVDNVEAHGCSIMSVFDPDGVLPSFSYSIGFPRSVGQPEVIVFSLPKNVRVFVINELRRQMAEEGLEISDHVELRDLLEGHSCIARKVTDKASLVEHLGSAIWYSRRFLGCELQTAYQIVWPGAQQGLFPWEDGCDDYVVSSQPPLYLKSFQ